MSNKISKLTIKLKKIFGFRASSFGFFRAKRGMYLPVILLASVVFIAFATAIISLSMSNLKMANLHNKRITSMSIAEAGVNYYLWHLAHINTDYCDGGTCPTVNADGSYGPFTHNDTDIAGNILGSYDLFITPPGSGNSITTVKSVGKVLGTNTTRTVITTIGMPSFTKYTLLVNNSELWVGNGEKVDGSVFINHNGVRNDGEITKDVSSTEATYNSGMFGGNHPGIWGAGIFDGSQLLPVPAIDFNQLNVDILTIRNKARDEHEGDYQDSAGSGYVGWHIILKADNYEIRKVKKYDSSGYDITKEDAGVSYSYPAAGVIFFEDNVWAEGTINNKKITIIAADPEAGSGQRKMIVIPSNIKYTNYDGKDKVGLITQTDITVSHNAPTNLEIDAAMIAKDGFISICPEILRPPYNKCPAHPQGYLRQKIKVYGSMAHNSGLIWTIDWGSGNLSGYNQTELVMDQQNVLNPPPKFPLTGTYAILSWREE
jgi:hypothetical protein